MSIAIDSMKCRACGKCLDVCPGSLIVRGEDKKAVIRYPKAAARFWNGNVMASPLMARGPQPCPMNMLSIML